MLVSLMGVGLAIDRVLDARSWRSWRTWSPVWRLLLGHHAADDRWASRCSAGGSPAWRRPSRCCSAPRSPRPTPCSPPTCRWASRSPRTSTTARAQDPSEDRRDEDDDIRFALTAEAGLNDGLAFPFVHLALLLLAGGFGLADAGGWLGWYVVGKIVVGVAVGVAVGWLLGRQAFHARSRHAPPGRPR